MPAEKQVIAIVSPCFNEGKIIADFLQHIEESIRSLSQRFILVMVDDSSEDDTLQQLQSFQFPQPHELHVLSLQYNIGHQGAIYQGLLYVSGLNVSQVIVMDSDGEDDPGAIPELVKLGNYGIVEVKRGKRKESLLFRVLYRFYKLLFRFITGKSMDYGNYCMISRTIVDRIAHTSFIHLPAYLLKQKTTRTSIRYNRKKRMDGKSRMGLKGLLFHAFKSLIEFGEDLLMMFLKLFGLIMILLAGLMGFLLYHKFITGKAIAGWFSSLTLGLVNLAMICIGFFILGILMLNLMHQQNNRTQKSIYRLVRRSQEAEKIHS